MLRNVQAHCFPNKYGKEVYTNNILKPLCVNCKFYNAGKQLCTHPAETYIDIVTGQKYHDKAYDVRRNNAKCGFDAKHYQKENIVVVKCREFFAKTEVIVFLDFLKFFFVGFLIAFVSYAFSKK
jgi:hypothetical protein